MKKMNLISRSFFIMLCLISFQLNAQEVSLWEINEGEGPIDFHTNNFGDQQAYERINIPPFDGPGWSLAGKVLSTEGPNQGKMVVGFNRTSKIAGAKNTGDCKEKVDFTYFKTEVFIPANMTISEFKIYYDWADDGARVYLFNSSHPYPHGHSNPDFDLVLGDPAKRNPKNIDFASQAKAGEINTVIIAQFDNCGTGNSVRGIHIKVNGAEVEPQKTITKPTNKPMADSSEVLSLDNKVFYIQTASSKGTGRVIEGQYDRLGADECPTRMWDKNTSPHQHWMFVPSSKGENYYYIENQSSRAGVSKRLDAGFTCLGTNGCGISLYQDNGGTDNQLWRVVRNSDGTYSLYIVHPNGQDHLLEADWNRLDSNGGGIRLWQSGQGAHQTWDLIPVN